MANAEVKSFDKADEVRPFKGKGHAEVVLVGGRPVVRAVFESGWRWSDHVKPIVGTESCQIMHLGYCVSGRMRVIMDDGTTGEVGPGEVMAIQPGHDAEVLGDEDCVVVDFGEAGEYAKPT